MDTILINWLLDRMSTETMDKWENKTFAEYKDRREVMKLYGK